MIGAVFLWHQLCAVNKSQRFLFLTLSAGSGSFKVLHKLFRTLYEYQLQLLISGYF